MTLDILTIPCLSDNYAYLIHDSATGATAVMDVPEAGPVEAALKDRGWTLTDILITHHHSDHIEGVDKLRAATGAKVTGAAADRHRLPALDRAVSEGDSISVGDSKAEVIDVSGHTVGHVAYHFPGAGAVFTADSLMALGCGRLFEGTADMMWRSLGKLTALPADTLVYSGHEYATGNARFALTIDPGNADLRARTDRIAEARASGRPTVPAPLSEELATNPFLRAADLSIRAHLGLGRASDAEVFAQIRRLKDRF